MKQNWKNISLKEACQINPPKKEVYDILNENQFVSFAPMTDLCVDKKYFIPKSEKKLKTVYNQYTFFKEGDVILAKITPCFENGKLGIATRLKNRIGFGSSEFIVYRYIVARSKMLWGNNVHRFHQIAGTIVIIFGLIVALGYI